MKPLTRVRRQAAVYDAKVEQGRLALLYKNIMSSPYMPSRNQVIELLTSLVTLALMMSVGPMIGNNYTLIQTLVRQVIPLIVHYVADLALPQVPEAV